MPLGTPASVLGNSNQLAQAPFGAVTGAVGGTGGTSHGSILPVTLFVKGVTILTAAAPADIATITIPAGITRWTASIAASTGGSWIIAESLAGTLAGAAFNVWDAAGGTGIEVINSSTTGPASLTGANSLKNLGPPSAAIAQVYSISSTLYIRQTGNSANAGTCSFYITIIPLV